MDNKVTTHSVKSWSYLFQQIKSGAKKADIRDMNDRPYKVGDLMVLNEFDQTRGEYTGEKIEVKITHIIDKNTPCAFSSAALGREYGILSIEITDREASVKKPTAGQIMAAEEAHYQFNAKWRKRDFISMQPPWGSFLIEEKPTWAGPSVHMQSIDHVDFYRYDLKEKRDAKFVQLMMEEIAKAVINA